MTFALRGKGEVVDPQAEDIQGDPSARGLGYVDISSVSYQGHPETELMST